MKTISSQCRSNFVRTIQASQTTQTENQAILKVNASTQTEFLRSTKSKMVSRSCQTNNYPASAVVQTDVTISPLVNLGKETPEINHQKDISSETNFNSKDTDKSETNCGIVCYRNVSIYDNPDSSIFSQNFSQSSRAALDSLSDVVVKAREQVVKGFSNLPDVKTNPGSNSILGFSNKSH